MGRIIKEGSNMANEMIDNSRLKATASCHTEAVVKYVFGYQGRDEPAPRKCGKCVHSSLERFFRTGGDVAKAMEVLEFEYRVFAEENVPDNDRLAWVNIKTIMEEFYANHPIERFPFTPVEGSEEKGVVKELYPGVSLFSLIDLQGIEKTIGGKYVIDHKSTGRVTEWWSKQFRIGSQLTGYMWSVDAVGAYVNAIEMAKLPTPATTKCRIHKVARSECWRQHAKWELLVTTRTPQFTSWWKRDAIALAKTFFGLKEMFEGRPELIQYVGMQGVFNNSCTFCDLRDFCTAEKNPDLIESMLVYAPWVPWEGV